MGTLITSAYCLPHLANVFGVWVGFKCTNLDDNSITLDIGGVLPGVVGCSDETKQEAPDDIMADLMAAAAAGNQDSLKHAVAVKLEQAGLFFVHSKSIS